MWLPAPGKDSPCIEDSKNHNNIKYQKLEATDLIHWVLQGLRIAEEDLAHKVLFGGVLYSQMGKETQQA